MDDHQSGRFLENIIRVDTQSQKFYRKILIHFLWLCFRASADRLKPLTVLPYSFSKNSERTFSHPAKDSQKIKPILFLIVLMTQLISCSSAILIWLLACRLFWPERYVTSPSGYPSSRVMAICGPGFIWPKDIHTLLNGSINMGLCPFFLLPFDIRRNGRHFYCWLTVLTQLHKLTPYHPLADVQVLKLTRRKFEVGHVSIFGGWFNKFLNIFNFLWWKFWNSTSSLLGYDWSVAKRVPYMLSWVLKMGLNFYQSVIVMSWEGVSRHLLQTFE